MAQAHWLDELAIDLGLYLEEEPQILADLIMEGYGPPFAAQADDAHKLAYYFDQFFLPDGSVNHDGRSQVMNAVGTDGYLKIVHALEEVHPHLFKQKLPFNAK